MNGPGSRFRLVTSSALLFLLVAGCGSGGGDGATSPTPPTTPPPPATTFTVTLQSVAASNSVDGTALDVSGEPIDGATATME